MSFRLPAQRLPNEDPFKDHSNHASNTNPDSDPSEDDDDDQEETWDDWVDDEATPCKSHFSDKVLPSVQDALEHDKREHEFDLGEACKRLGESPDLAFGVIPAMSRIVWNGGEQWYSGGTNAQGGWGRG